MRVRVAALRRSRRPGVPVRRVMRRGLWTIRSSDRDDHGRVPLPSRRGAFDECTHKYTEYTHKLQSKSIMMPEMQDLRFAIRALWLRKGFTAAAVLTLAIGLGANTALFGLLDAALRPMDLPDAEQLVVVAADVRGDETGGFQFHFSTPQMKDFQQRADAFSSVTGFLTQVGGLSVEGSGSSTSTQFWLMAVSDNFFSGLRVTPAIGTLFTKPSGSPVHVVLGHRCWTTVFGGDPNVLGRPV